jgi:nicotinamidase-related amidase
MRNRFAVIGAVVAIVAAATSAAISPTIAGNIIDEWANAKAPPPPALKPVTVDIKTNALLVIDMVKQTCNPQARPRCVETIPAVQKLLNEARAKGMTIIYSLGTLGPDILEELAPKNGEVIVKSGADKFVNTELEKTLKDKGISGVIVVGTLANGGVLHTASAAALRGFNVVVPVDGISSTNLYMEQYAAWHLANGPFPPAKVTLTKTDMIKF